MRFFGKRYYKFLSLAIVIGACGLFFVKNRLWAVMAKTSISVPQKPADQKQASAKAGSLSAVRSKEQALKVADATRKKVSSEKREVGRQRLIKEREKQRQRDGVDQKTLQEVVESKQSDRFTQTEALLQLPEIRSLIQNKSEITPYLNIVSAVINKEVEHRDTHYAFYHTTETAWRVAQDVYTQLFSYFKTQGRGVDDTFKFLRFGTFKSAPFARDFLLKELESSGLIDDKGHLAAVLLSVNLSLFGNIGVESECSWQYFLREKRHFEPDRGIYESIMKEFGLPYSYIDELISLADVLQTKEKMILQVMIPKNRVDDIAYLAWKSGIPAYEGIITWVTSNVKKKKFVYKEGKAAGAWALDSLADQFVKQGEKNPLYKGLIEKVKEGDFSVEALLKMYCNKPWDVPNINETQARLIFSPEVLLNPSSGIKIYRYSMAGHNQLTEYHNRLNSVVKKLIDSKQK